MTPDLPALLDEFREDLVSFLRAHAGWILRYETPDDLVQDLQVRALERGRDFEYRGREQFLQWVYTVARTYLADRKTYWSALKRRSANLVRLTAGATPGEGTAAAPEPVRDSTGPSTLASRKEQLALAVKALAVLPRRDRRLVRWTSEGVDLKEQAERLGMTYDTAKHARARALERFRKAYELGLRR